MSNRPVLTVVMVLFLSMGTLALTSGGSVVQMTSFAFNGKQHSALRLEKLNLSVQSSLDEGAKIFVDPKDNTYYAFEKRMNDTITVNVTVANMTGFVGVEFKLYWNATLLSCTSFTENLFATVTPPGEQDNIWRVKRDIDNTGGYIHYAYTFLDQNRATSGGYGPINITQAQYVEGKLAAAVLNFTIIRMPPANGYVDCPLHLWSLEVHDPAGNVILVHTEDGYYRLISPNGDINGDHIVDIADAILLSDAYGSGPADSYWDPKADMNSDDIIDILDAIVFATNFGKAFP